MKVWLVWATGIDSRHLHSIHTTAVGAEREADAMNVAARAEREADDPWDPELGDTRFTALSEPMEVQS